MSAAAKEFLAIIGTGIASWLEAPGTWNLGKTMDTAFHLNGPDGMEIVFWAGSCNPGDLASVRFEVTGKYPPDVCVMREDKPRINVSAKKGTKAIARDVERRFLSEHKPLYYKKLEIQQEIERGRNARERVMATLQEAFDFREVRDKDGHLERLETSYGDGKFPYRGKVNANYTTSLKPASERGWEVTLKLENLTVNQALRIAEVLKEPRFPTEQLSLF